MEKTQTKRFIYSLVVLATALFVWYVGWTATQVVELIKLTNTI